jgi:hypothetical protein
MFCFDPEFCLKTEYIRSFFGTKAGKRKLSILKELCEIDEDGEQKMEVVSRQLEIMSRQLEIISIQMEVIKRQMEVRSIQIKIRN